MSFFAPTTTSAGRQPPTLVPKCGACGLYRGCHTPKMKIRGSGQLGVLIVAEAPGQHEDEQGRPLVGPAGQVLRTALARIGVDLDRDCWATNALICRPPGNRAPTADEVDHCRPNLLKAVRDLNPKLIIPLGGAAVKSVLEPIWREDVGPVSVWVGWNIPSQKLNAWVCPTYHPSFVMRSEEERDRRGDVIKLWFRKHLEAAFARTERPWQTVPNYPEQVRVLLDPGEAAAWLRSVVTRGGACAFDYETNRLKPDNRDAEIVSCAVSWRGLETVAFPWQGEVLPAMREFLQSELPKIGSNTKFETRWTRSMLGCDVRNWVWDAMLAAHTLDNRPGVTSTKFQGFVRLGVGDWGERIKPFLEGDATGRNRIREVNLRDLLVYNGQDALVEYLIAIDQKKEMQG